MKFHDLVLLLDNRSGRYDEVVVFARHLDLADVEACVGERPLVHFEGEAQQQAIFGFAYGNVWRMLRVEEKLGIVVLWSGEDPTGRDFDGAVTEGVAVAGILGSSLRHASAVPVDESVPYTVRQEHFALLRKREGVLHRNLLMEWREIAGAPPSSSGKWMTVDCSEHSAKPFLAWVKRSLWADVPMPDLSKCKMDLGLRYPFPGADAHPDKHGGELCVEGTNLRVRDLLLGFLEWPVAAEAPTRKLAADLHVDESVLRSCLRGLSNWLKTQTWVDRHVQCEGCARRRTYKCAPPFDGSACPDRSVARNRYDDGPGDVTSEDCAKLEGICRETYFDMAWVQREIERGYRSGQRELAKMVTAASTSPSAPGTEGGFRCKGCGTVFLASAKDKEGRPCVRSGHAVCPECSRAWLVDAVITVEKRCGTCNEWRVVEDETPPNFDRYCRFLHTNMREDGPPWENCRFWKPCEEKK